MGLTDYKVFHSTCIGASHIKSGTVCQDASAAGEGDGFHYIVVCDGHGGADYFRSDRGSKLAVTAFETCVNSPALFAALLKASRDKQRDELIMQFIKSVIANWSAAVDEDYTAHPFSEEEMAEVSAKARSRYEQGERIQSAYGTTLLGAVVTDDFWLGIHIGDGKCVAFSESGDFSQPIPWDDRCFLNVTTSICDSDALSEFRFAYSRELPVAICIGSDGIDDCFAGDERLHSFYRVALNSFGTTEYDAAVKELSDYLPTLSRIGSGDDMSVGILFDAQRLTSMDVMPKPPVEEAVPEETPEAEPAVPEEKVLTISEETAEEAVSPEQA